MTRQTTLDDRGDAELVEQVLAGDRESFSILVLRYQRPLYRYALGMLGHADTAADLVQESLIKAYGRLASCRDPDTFGRWLFRILRNGCLDYLKSSRRREVSLEELTAPPLARDSAEERLANSELGRAVQAALRTLTPSRREAFLLKHVEDLSYEEMAERLDANVSALKMRVKRAREDLQEALRGAMEIDEWV